MHIHPRFDRLDPPGPPQSDCVSLSLLKMCRLFVFTKTETDPKQRLLSASDIKSSHLRVTCVLHPPRMLEFATVLTPHMPEMPCKLARNSVQHPLPLTRSFRYIHVYALHPPYVSTIIRRYLSRAPQIYIYVLHFDLHFRPHIIYILLSLSLGRLFRNHRWGTLPCRVWCRSVGQHKNSLSGHGFGYKYCHQYAKIWLIKHCCDVRRIFLRVPQSQRRYARHMWYVWPNRAGWVPSWHTWTMHTCECNVVPRQQQQKHL